MGDLISNYILSQGLNAPGTVYSDGRQNTYENEALKNIAANLGQEYGLRESGIGYNLTPLGNPEKYTDLGLKPSVQLLKAQENGSLDKIMADAQSAKSKFVNALEQTLVSEIGIGTIKAISDLVDAVGQIVGASDHDYNNPVSRKLDEWQETFKNEVAPIYTTPGVNISNGGLTDAGWWASNMPSIASSLTLLIPSTGATKLLGWAGKGAVRGTRTATKWAARASKLNDVEKAQKAYAATRAAMELSTGTKATLNMMGYVGTNALLSRTMENFQESRQVYDDMYEEASTSLNQMTDEEYNDFLKRNAITLEGVDTSNKDEVAKAVAIKSADETFKDDFSNVVFDAIEIYALRNLNFKGLRNQQSRASLRRKHLDSIKYPGMSDAEIAVEKAKRSFWEKSTEKAEDWFIGGRTAIAGQLSEGVEEAVNYVAQQEGMNLGHVMLGNADDSVFAKRMAEYAKAPELWESAFWGLAGGVVFQSAGSGLNRLSNAISNYNADKKRTNEKTGETTKKSTWTELFELPEMKRRKADIEARHQDLMTYKQRLDAIVNQSINPFEKVGPEGARTISENEKEILKEKAYNEMLTSMTLRAMESGNFDMLKEYLSSNEIRDAIVSSGLVSASDATRYQQNAIANMDKIAAQYDENVKALDTLSKKINKRTNLPIPVDYLQIIARNNIEHQITIDDFNAQIAAWEADEAKQREFFKDKLDESVNYKDAVRLVFLTQQLGQLEAQKKALLKDKDTAKTVTGQQAIEDLNKNIGTIKDMIYGLNPDNASSNLLFAIQNAMSFEQDEHGKIRSNNASTAYRDIRRKVVQLEREEDAAAIEEIDKYLTSLDPRLAGIGKSELYRTKLLDDAVRRAYDETKGLDVIAKDLHDTYFRLADLQTAAAIERTQIVLTEDEFTKEVSKLHNFMNETRKKALETARTTIMGLADTYGTDKIREALVQKYQGNTLKQDYFGEDAKAISDSQVFNDAVDIFHLDADVNKDLFAVIDTLLELHDATKAAESKNNVISEEENTAPQNSQVDNSTQTQQQANTEQKEQTETAAPQPQAPLQTSENGIEYLEDGGVPFASLIPTGNDREYILDIDERHRTNPEAIALLNNPEIYDKLGVTLTEDYLITEKPIVSYDFHGNLIARKKGKIEAATPENVEKVEEEDNGIAVASEPSTALPSSTGGLNSNVTNPSNVVAPVSSSTEENATKDVAPAALDETDKISANAHKDVIDELRNAKLKDVVINWNELQKELTAKYVDSAQDKVAAAQYVENAIAWGKKMAERYNLKQENVVDEVLIKASSITEKTRADSNAAKDFAKAVDKLVKKYKDDVAIDYYDGKYYVRLDDLLRYCNEISETTAAGELLYNNLLNYMQSSDNFVIIDERLGDALTRATQPTVTRLSNLKTNNVLFGINFDGVLAELEAAGMNNEVQRVLSLIDNLNIGDKISYRVDNNVILFTIDDTIIGRLPLPKIGEQGERWQYNDGWKTDILVNNQGKIQSKLKDLFTKWLTDTSDPNIKELNELAIKAAFGNLKQSELNILAKQFEKNPEIRNAINAGYIDSKEDMTKVLKGLGKVWGYTRQIAGLSVEETNELRLDSLDSWFENQVAPSYALVEKLHAQGNGEVQAGYISEGELIITSTKDMLPASKAIGKKHKGKVKIAAAESIGTLTLAGKGINGQTQVPFSGIGGGVTTGSTVVVIPARNGQHGFVHAYPQSITSNQLKPKAKEVVKAIFAELDRIGNEGTTQQVCDNLESFLLNTINAPGNSITPLFRVNGKGIQKLVDKNTGATIGFSIQYWDSNRANHTINISWKGYNKSTNSNYVRGGLTVYVDGVLAVNANTKDAIKRIKDVLSEQAKFNLAYNFIKSDNNTSMTLQGLASRNDKEEFVIKVPNQGEFVFSSFNDFIIDNDTVSLKTEPGPEENNYSRKSTTGNQVANQVIKITTNLDTQSPVEEENTESAPVIPDTTAKQVLDILNDANSSVPAGIRIAKLILGNKVKNLKIGSKIFDLFPQNIKFVNEYIGDNAIINIDTKAGPIEGHPDIVLEPGQVLVGKEWLDMINGTVAQKKQAVRKLAHERLHQVLHSNGNEKYIEQIRNIFDEFAAKNTNESLNKYLFNTTEDTIKEYWTDGKLNEAGLEEFLVETLTSEELANALNNIKSKENINGKIVEKSLLQKIMERLASIFGWRIKKGSLYEKEFNLLRDIIGSEPATTETTEPTTTKEVNLEEPVTKEVVAQEQAAKETGKNNDEMEFGDEFTGMFKFSTITEKEPTSTSITSFVSTLPIEDQSGVIDKINNGDIQISCK